MKYIIFLLNLIGVHMSNANIQDTKRTKLIELNPKINFLVFLIISSFPLYLIYYSIYNHTNEILSTIFIMLIPPINYIVLLNYFKRTYFFKIYTDIIYNDDYTKYKLDKIIFYISLTLTLSTMILSCIFKILGYKSLILDNNISNIGFRISLILYSIIYNFYSRFIFFFNTIIFFVVFYKHYIDISKQIEDIKLIKSWSNDKYKSAISVISYNLLFIRNEIKKSIDLLEYIYISSTLLGCIAIGVILENNIMNIFLVGSIIIWSFIQIIFLYIMTLITNKREELLEFINKPRFCCHYLMKTIGSSTDIISLIDNDRRRDYFTQFISDSIKTQYNGTSSSKTSPNIELKTIKIDENNRENIMNNKKEEKELQEQEEIIRIRTTGSSEGSGYIIEDKRQPISSQMYNIKQLKTTGIENSSSIDWIILNKILSDNWATFQFMGIQFDNSDSIKKVIGMVGLTIYGFKYLLTNFHL
tara:strand:+ start:2089 stop:3504 length:1416 start_codon:yes stop_codon:yes gene_type:complete